MASEAPLESGQPRLSVWLPCGGGILPRLSALTEDGRFRVMPEAHDMDLHACGPLMTSHVRRFTVDTGQSGEAEIPLPVLDFLPRRASWTDLGMVAADIEVRSESPNPAGDTGMIVPAARCVAPYLRAFIPFTRPRSASPAPRSIATSPGRARLRQAERHARPTEHESPAPLVIGPGSRTASGPPGRQLGSVPHCESQFDPPELVVMVFIPSGDGRRTISYRVRCVLALALTLQPPGSGRPVR